MVRLSARTRPSTFRLYRARLLEPAEDLAQEVCAEAAVHVQTLHGPRKGDLLYRWIHTVTRHKIADHFRARKHRAEAEPIGGPQPELAQIPDANHDTLDPHTDDGCMQILVAAMSLVRAVVAPRTWRAFEAVVLERRKAGEVALELGVLPDFVNDAACRVSQRVIEIGKKLARLEEPPTQISAGPPLLAETTFDRRRLPL